LICRIKKKVLFNLTCIQIVLSKLHVNLTKTSKEILFNAPCIILPILHLMPFLKLSAKISKLIVLKL